MADGEYDRRTKIPLVGSASALAESLDNSKHDKESRQGPVLEMARLKSAVPEKVWELL